MSNVYKFDNLEDLLQCVICLDRFQIPKVLTCQHTFCLRCLQRLYDSAHQTLTCPTCRKVMHLPRGPNELPGNILLTNLMDVQPAKAKCPCCHKIETLTICEHCNSTKCANCNEQHINDIRQSTRTTIEELKDTNENNLKVSIHDAFKTVRNEICNRFQNIRQHHDAILLNKQLDILKQLDFHERNLLTDVENDLQPLEQSRAELTEKNYHLESKNEPELVDLLTKASNIQSRLATKLAEHYAHLNTIEVTLQYDPDQINQINQLCNRMRLNISYTTEQKASQSTNVLIPSESICLILRTSLNQEYKYHVALDKTVYELKEMFGKQENLHANQIILTKPGNFFDQLDDNRTLRSYDCDSTTILMISVQK
ncbi:unnamed protein product [Adineta ricciae]|uniref:RING-type domain-containing protein n=1 Tax=Adineta ricciae TaxID=249248 RepID=A0A816DLP7_ADIRI|nr:unnamed protein product [Adineta ricciae]